MLTRGGSGWCRGGLWAPIRERIAKEARLAASIPDTSSLRPIRQAPGAATPPWGVRVGEGSDPARIWGARGGPALFSCFERILRKRVSRSRGPSANPSAMLVAPVFLCTLAHGAACLESCTGRRPQVFQGLVRERGGWMTRGRRRAPPGTTQVRRRTMGGLAPVALCRCQSAGPSWPAVLAPVPYRSCGRPLAGRAPGLFPPHPANLVVDRHEPTAERTQQWPLSRLASTGSAVSVRLLAAH